MTQDSKSNTLRAGKKHNFLTLEWFGQTQQKISQLICLKDGARIECKHCLERWLNLRKFFSLALISKTCLSQLINYNNYNNKVDSIHVNLNRSFD